MNLFHDKICTICLKQSDNLFKKYDDIMITEIPVLKHIQLKSLCIWCVTALKKISKFLTLILESQEILINYQDNNNSKVQDYGHHNLSICINESVHIQPFSEVFVKEVNNELFYNEDVDVVRKNISTHEKKKKLLIRKSKKQSIYSDMKFKVEFLSIENQKLEIEKRKKSLKYKERLYKCESCGVGFLTEDVFEDHRKRHTMESGTHICKICSLRFKSKSVLSQHVLLHSRLFMCTLCGLNIKKWSHAVTHRHKCGSVCVTVCVYCGKVFENKHSLEVHLKGHTKEKKYECTECQSKFVTKQRLRVHTRLHTGFKPFTCDCGKKFTTKSNLKSHQNVHSRLKNHYCVECNTSYKTDRGLKKHLSESVKHSRDRPTGISCSHCNKTFSSEATLTSHQRVKHLTRYTCDICNKNFSSSSNLRKHIRCIHKTEEFSD